MDIAELKDIFRTIEKQTGVKWEKVAKSLCSNHHRIPKNNAFLASLEENYCIILKSEDGYGGEGCGDEYWGIFSVQDNGYLRAFFRINGYYSSYDDCEIEAWSFEQVKKVPIQTFEWQSM